jgi:hypothetical protein
MLAFLILYSCDYINLSSKTIFKYSFRIFFESLDFTFNASHLYPEKAPGNTFINPKLLSKDFSYTYPVVYLFI